MGLFVRLLAAASVCTLAACAGPGPRGGERPDGPAPGERLVRPRADALLLMSADVDRDGRLTLEEAADGGVALARAVDDGDGRLGAIELQALGERFGGAPEAAPLLALADANGDGAAALSEIAAHFQGRVRQLDIDGDGAVSRAELVERIAIPSRQPPEPPRSRVVPPTPN